MHTIEQFCNPGHAYRGKPFWSWNGKLNRDELLRQADIFQQMGFGGYFMHSRVGLATPYLGDEWFDLINACADRAEELGLEAFIYDEDRWPSGTAGGKVTENPEYRMHFVRLHINEPIPDGAEVMAIFTGHLSGLAFSDKRRITGLDGASSAGQAGLDFIWFDRVAFPMSSFYNGYTYVDTMNPAATDAFIEITHEQYKARCGPRIGAVIRGVFTDEPHRGQVMCDTQFDGMAVPVTPALWQVFRERWGYDLTDYLPELFLQPDGEKVSPVKWHYMETTQQLFLDHFAAPVSAWCRANGLALTGHVLHEDSLSAQSIMQGSLMRFYPYMDIPGVDVLTEGNTNYCVVKQLSSVAHQLGQTWLLSELYGCTGWQMDFTGHKHIGDWQALMGINVRCPHLSWYTMAGEAKRDFPASIFHQSAWYREYAYVEDYFARLGVFLQQGQPVLDCLVISPVESVWCQIHAGWSSWLYAKDPDIALLDARYTALCEGLLAHHVLFDLADEAMLADLAVVEGRLLRVGQASYRRVVISGMLTMRSSTLSILQDLLKAGGEVCVIGQMPACLDARPAVLDLPARQMPLADESLAVLANEWVSIDDPRIFVEIRSDDSGQWIMLLNTDRSASVTAQITLHRPGFVEEWCPRSGQRYAFAPTGAVIFPAGGELLLHIGDEDAGLPYRQQPVPGNSLELGQPSSYALDEPNIAVLDRASCQVDGMLIEETDVLRIDQALRDRYGLGHRGAEMLQPWFIGQRTCPDLGQVVLDYDFYLDAGAGPATLVIEHASQYQVMLNGHPLNRSEGFWIDICFDLMPIEPAWLQPGLNTIRVSFPFREDSQIEAIYLLGTFGVHLDGTQVHLAHLPEQLFLGDLCGQGLPFYSGKIAYRFSGPDADGPGLVRLESLGQAACARINGQIVAFRPFEALVENCREIIVELVLTRRNTFGPLHQKTLHSAGYGPDNFVTRGADYAEEPVLYPTGLDRSPLLYPLMGGAT